MSDTLSYILALLCLAGIGVYFFRESFVFYTDRFIPDNHDAATIWFFILIRPSAKEDKGLLEHELFHQYEFLTTAGFSGILRRISKSFRLYSEVMAYSIQFMEDYYKYPLDTARYDRKLNMYSHRIANYYDLDVTSEKARRRLSHCLKENFNVYV